MRIRHIYITKEGEPMANPEMDYPETPNYYANEDHSDMPQEYQDSMDRQLRMGYGARVKQYHSGLLPFEDFNEIKDEMFYQTTGGPHIDMPFESIFNPDTIIPVDLEAEVVEYRVLDELDKLYDIRKVLRVKP